MPQARFAVCVSRFTPSLSVRPALRQTGDGGGGLLIAADTLQNVCRHADCVTRRGGEAVRPRGRAAVLIPCDDDQAGTRGCDDILVDSLGADETSDCIALQATALGILRTRTLLRSGLARSECAGS
jgi:hypothetical protein